MCYLCTANKGLKKQMYTARGLQEFEWDMVQHAWVSTAKTAPTPPMGVPAPAQPGQGSAPAHAPQAFNPLGGIVQAPNKFGPGQGPQPVTKTNSTNDPRIIWEDGLVAIIYAKDFPAGTGMGRSKTRADLKDAINATIDDQLVTAPGKGSMHDFVKVWLKDLLARPLPGPAAPKIQGRLPIDPKQFIPVAPVIAKSGRYAGQIIPDFPHDCTACGGKYYQGMFSGVHDTPDGRCPAEAKSAGKKRK